MEKYSFFNTYFVRQAVLPFSDVQKNPIINQNNKVDTICRNPMFRQAILCASESLYCSMNKYLEGKIKDLKRKRQIELSLSQYWIRMSSRATPFGLFSYVSIAKDSAPRRENTTLRAMIDADYEWIWLLSKRLEVIGYKELSFVSNGLISEQVDSFRLPYIPGESFKASIKIKKTAIVSFLIDKCASKNYTYHELAREVQGNLPGITSIEFDQTIQMLLEKDFLISELRPELSSPHLLSSLIDRIEQKESFELIIEQLKMISKQMELVSQNIFNVDIEDLLLELIHNMRELNDTAHVIKTDLINKSCLDILGNEDIKEITEFANFFIEAVAQSQNRFTLYDEYKDSFLNKYGEFQLVPLSRMLNKQKGIGVPHDFKESSKKRKGVKSYPVEVPERILKYMTAKYREALQNGTTIQIDDLAAVLGEQVTTSILPKSFELIFKVATDENGNRVFVCNKDYGCIGAGRTIGRFSNDWLEAMNVIRKLDENVQLDDEYIECDLMYLPQRVHLGNVATSPNINSYQLSYYQYSADTSLRIPLSDIYVGIKDDKFFLFSKQLKKKLRINASNLLYYYGDCPEIRFLKEVQLDDVVRFDTIAFEKLNHFDYMPEIKYKSVVVRPETWIISPPKHLLKFEEFDEWFYNKYNFLCGKNLAISFADNELKINIENKDSRYLIYKNCIQNSTTMLVNAYSSLSIPQTTEVVIPFILENPTNSHYDTYSQTAFDDEIECNHNAFMMLGDDDWLSIELYGCYNIDAYIAKELTELLGCLHNDGLITSFYYIQYADPIYHIRLRLFNSKILNSIGEIVSRLNEHVRAHHIESFKLCPYDRETERYGGLEGMLVAEKIFCADSNCSIFLLQQYTHEEQEMYYVIAALDYLQIWGWNLEQQLMWIENHTTCKGMYSRMWRQVHSSYYKHYSEKNKTYMPEELLTDRLENIKRYSSCEIPLEMQSRILSALLHMSFNRIFGMDKEREKRLLSYVYNLLHEIVARDSKSLE